MIKLPGNRRVFTPRTFQNQMKAELRYRGLAAVPTRELELLTEIAATANIINDIRQQRSRVSGAVWAKLGSALASYKHWESMRGSTPPSAIKTHEEHVMDMS